MSVQSASILHSIMKTVCLFANLVYLDTTLIDGVVRRTYALKIPFNPIPWFGFIEFVDFSKLPRRFYIYFHKLIWNLNFWALV